MASVELVCRECGAGFTAGRSDAFRCPSCRAADLAHRSAAYEKRSKDPCPDCGNLKARKATRCRSCENKLRNGNRSMEKSNSWKGGRHQRKRDGYIEILVAPNKRVLEHRYIWEQAHGPLPKNWVVHHLNGIKDDNRLENLVGMSRSHHGPRAHIDPSQYESRIRFLEARISELEGS